MRDNIARNLGSAALAIALGFAFATPAHAWRETKGGDPLVARMNVLSDFLANRAEVERETATLLAEAGSQAPMTSRSGTMKIARARSSRVQQCLQRMALVADSSETPSLSAVQLSASGAPVALPIRVRGRCPNLEVQIGVRPIAQYNWSARQVVALIIDAIDANDTIGAVSGGELMRVAPALLTIRSFGADGSRVSLEDPRLELQLKDSVRAFLARVGSLVENSGRLQALARDVAASAYRFRSGCVDENGTRRMAVARMGELGGEICFDLDYADLRGADPADFIATALHEHAHHFGDADADHALFRQVRAEVRAEDFRFAWDPSASEPRFADPLYGWSLEFTDTVSSATRTRAGEIAFGGPDAQCALKNYESNVTRSPGDHWITRDVAVTMPAAIDRTRYIFSFADGAPFHALHCSVAKGWLTPSDVFRLSKGALQFHSRRQ